MGIEIKKEIPTTPTTIQKGGFLKVTYKRGNETMVEFEEEMKQDMTVDTFLLVELKDEPGYENGIGGIVAKKEIR